MMAWSQLRASSSRADRMVVMGWLGSTLRSRFSHPLPNVEHGATMVEYAVMLGLIAAVCFAAVKLLGSEVADLFSSLPAPF